MHVRHRVPWQLAILCALTGVLLLGGQLLAQTDAGYALSFDGVDDLLDYGSNPSLNWSVTDSFTYECWVKVPPSS